MTEGRGSLGARRRPVTIAAMNSLGGSRQGGHVCIRVRRDAAAAQIIVIALPIIFFSRTLEFHHNES
jgi:hypothetical protein